MSSKNPMSICNLSKCQNISHIWSKFFLSNVVILLRCMIKEFQQIIKIQIVLMNCHTEKCISN